MLKTPDLSSETAEIVEAEIEPFASVWDALEDCPEDVVIMKISSQLMQAIQSLVKSWHVSQTTAAEHLRITQPRLSDLMRGKISRFGLEGLMQIAVRAGIDVEITLTAPATINHPHCPLGDLPQVSA